MNCINLKQKLDRKLFCKHKNCIIKISECKSCPYKEFKGTTYKIKKRTSKLTKMEKDRFSIFTDDLDHCIICGKSPINKHEIFYGSKNRQKSIQYGLVIPLCTSIHHNQIGQTGIHFDKNLKKEWQIKGQEIFEKTYPELDFKKEFGKSYK